ncbi:MAG: amidohydrolase family protein [Halioglobus sp.]
MKNFTRLFSYAFLLMLLGVAGSSIAEEKSVLIRNVNVFDGVNDKLHRDYDVLVVGEVIAQFSASSIEAPAGATIIDGGGRTLMPGMIDVHTHLAITTSLSDIHGNITPEENAIRSTVIARDFLADGFTTVRDVGGNTFGLKKSIDSGLIPGPRIFPSGAFLSQTSGHGDFRTQAEPHPSTGHIDAGHRLAMGIVADGKAEVYRAVRENLRKGATQIKMMGSGGAGSDFDPIDSLQFQPEEQMAAVAATKDWGTYVTAHLLDDRAIDRALDSGVMCVDHGLMIREGSMKKLVKMGVFLAPQFNALSPRLEELPGLKPVNIEKIRAAQQLMEPLVPLIRKYKPKVPFAVDAFGPPVNHIRQRRYELYYVAELFGNYEALRRATSVSGELLAMSGSRNPYGKLGVIEVGALADVLLIDGNPLEDITLVGGDPAWWDAATDEIATMPLVMKGGVIFRNRL